MMNVNESRGATTEFLTHGLGSRLTQAADIMAGPFGDRSPTDYQRLSRAYACGNIIERVLWISEGHWMGYFEDVAPISSDERDFLREYAPIFNDYGMPQTFENLLRILVDSDTNIDEMFFQNHPVNLRLPRSVREWFPIFQAAIITSEAVTEGPMTSFFLFLRAGNVEEFNNHSPSPDAIMRQLNDEHHFHQLRGGYTVPESVIAGFIRFTEFISTLEAIFPSVTQPTGWMSGKNAARLVDRDILYLYSRPFQWRFPASVTATNAYTSVLSAFLKLTAVEFNKYPELGLQWSAVETAAEVSRLSYRFFGSPDFRGDKLRGESQEPSPEAQRRIRALSSRLQQLAEGGRVEGFEDEKGGQS